VVVVGLEAKQQHPHVRDRVVHLLSGGLCRLDRDGLHLPRAELAFLLVAQPVAGALGDMMSGDPSRLFKWTTAICSAATIGFLVAAAVRENISADWRGYQTAFRGILETKAASDAARTSARSFPIEIRQVVVPALQTLFLGRDDRAVVPTAPGAVPAED
jgi:hypothetical protein